MKKTYYPICFFLVVLFCCSCTDSKNSKLIVGDWQGAQWLVNGNPSPNNALATSFSFKANSEYTFNNSGAVEKGNYKIKDDKLYTTPYDQLEIMVKIAKLTADSLVFDMNRGGQSETLVLLRKNN